MNIADSLDNVTEEARQIWLMLDQIVEDRWVSMESLACYLSPLARWLPPQSWRPIFHELGTHRLLAHRVNKGVVELSRWQNRLTVEPDVVAKLPLLRSNILYNFQDWTAFNWDVWQDTLLASDIETEALWQLNAIYIRCHAQTLIESRDSGRQVRATKSCCNGPHSGVGMKEITPSAPLGEMIVKLLSRPHAPVSRSFIDRQLNKQREPRLNQVINDTLIWLHLMERIQKQFREPRNHDELEEATVFFWIADTEYDGYVNDVPNLSKYVISHIIGSTPQPSKSEAEDEDQAEEEPVEEDDGELEYTDEDGSADVESPEEETEPEQPPVESKADLERQIAALKPDEPVAPKESTDKRIMDWARMQLDPWTRDRCVEEVEGTRAIISMRLSMLVSYGRLKENAKGLMIASEFARADFFAIEPKPRVKTTRKPRATESAIVVPAAKLAQSEVASELMEAMPSGTIEPVAVAPQVASFQHLVVDAADPKFAVDCDGAFKLKVPNLTIELTPQTMKALAVFAKRFNLLNAYEN